jgi:hypothetical protein
VLLEEFHASTIAGHSGITKTYGRLKENVYWVGMKRDVVKFVNACLICQQTKNSTQLPYGLLKLLPIPTAVWEDISLDFIVGLPSFQSHTVILVVVDRLSKAAHFGSLPTNFTACKVAELFCQMICKLHGMPRSIVSDRDPIFLGHFWQELFKLSGTKLRMSSAYHPQSDDQTEIVNKTLQQYLRCFVHDQPKKWGKFLHWAEWHYNTSIHASTGLTPFEVVYGRPPPSLPQYIRESTNLEAVESELTIRDEILTKLKNKLKKAQESMKLYADKKRGPHTFLPGDLVFVKLRSYRQSTLGEQLTNKLTKRYYGAFKLLKAINDVAFEVELPPTSRIHPVFHVSQLKPCQAHNSAALPLPPKDHDNLPLVEPAHILDWQPPKVLIQWSGLYLEDATWEDIDEMKKLYPSFHLEDKVFVEGEGDVMTQADEPEEMAGFSEEDDPPIPDSRPKRKTTRPKHLNDYHVPKLAVKNH